MNNLKRNENESLLGYYKRLVDNRKEYDLDYSELGEIILGESKYSSDNVRKAVYLLKPILEKLEEESLSNVNTDIAAEIRNQKLELEKEKIRFQDQKREYKKYLRLEGVR